MFRGYVQSSKFRQIIATLIFLFVFDCIFTILSINNQDASNVSTITIEALNSGRRKKIIRILSFRAVEAFGPAILSEIPYFINDSILIIGMTNNAEKKITSLLTQIDQISCLFNNTVYLFYESNSKDNTLKKLKSWSNKEYNLCKQYKSYNTTTFYPDVYKSLYFKYNKRNLYVTPISTTIQLESNKTIYSTNAKSRNDTDLDIYPQEINQFEPNMVSKNIKA